jgi:hypothetical protein
MLEIIEKNDFFSFDYLCWLTTLEWHVPQINASSPQRALICGNTQLGG